MEVMNNNAQDARAPQVPPKTWLVESILITIFCCLPFGIVGIVYASKVESRFYAGQIEASLKASRDAGKWTKLGFWLGLAYWLICIGLYVGIFTFGFLGAASSSIFNAA
jgi:hypothetical protein